MTDPFGGEQCRHWVENNGWTSSVLGVWEGQGDRLRNKGAMGKRDGREE